MKTEYIIKPSDKYINTTVVKIIVEEKTFKQMLETIDKRIKDSITRFYKTFINNL